jgi:hypothetical protein
MKSSGGQHNLAHVKRHQLGNVVCGGDEETRVRAFHAAARLTVFLEI